MSQALPNGDTFSRIVAEHRAPILRHVKSLVRDPDEAEDITQETFFRAYRKLSALRDPDKLSAWLYRIATRLSYDRFRQRSSRPRLQSLDGAAADGSPRTEPADRVEPRLDRLLEQKEMSGCVRQYLEELSDDYRAAILLHDFQGLTNPEIADMLGCSLATVKIRLHRARHKLRAALDRACDFSRDERGVFVCEPKASPGRSDSEPGPAD